MKHLTDHHRTPPADRPQHHALIIKAECLLVEADTKGVPFALWLLLGVGGFASAGVLGLLEIRLAWIELGDRNARGLNSCPPSSQATKIPEQPEHERRMQGGRELSEHERAAAKRRATAAALVVLILVGGTAFILVWQSLGGGGITFGALAFLCYVGIRGAWWRWSDSLKNIFRK